MPRVEARIGWMQGAVRRQWLPIAKCCNAADADPGLNPKGRLPAGVYALLGYIAALQVARGD